MVTLQSGKPSRRGSGGPGRRIYAVGILVALLLMVPLAGSAAGAEGGALQTAGTVIEVGTKIHAFSTCAAGGTQLYGCALKAMSGPVGEIQTSLKAVHEKLDALSKQMETIHSDLGKLHLAILKQDWDRVLAGLNTHFHAATVKGAFAELVNATNPALAEGDRLTEARNAQTKMNALFSTGAAATMLKDHLIGVGETPPIIVFSQLVHKQLELNGGFLRDTASAKGMRPTADDIQDVWQYLNDFQEKTMLLQLVWAGTQDYTPTLVDAKYLYPYVGLPAGGVHAASTKNCPETLVGSPITNCRGWLEREWRIAPQPLPAGTTIDLRTKLMWTKHVAEAKFYNLPYVGCLATYSNNYTGDTCRTPNTRVTDHVDHTSPLHNWFTPSRSQLGELFHSANPRAPAEPRLSTISSGQQLSEAGGFFGHGGGIQQIHDPVFWTSTGLGTLDFAIGQPGHESFRFHYFHSNYVVDLNNGQHGQRRTNTEINTWNISARMTTHCEHYLTSTPDGC